ncbi:MAG: elongation factor Tu [Candidatus Nealsonbacteria bacterium]|nr:elongation factor Tu [Candidatus Nealsonbacteria bacterium]
MSILDDYHEIETEIRYLTTAEGGRSKGVWSGYRGQFYYEDEDFDGSQFFPDIADDEMVELGTSVRALVRFLRERWEDVHAARITIGMPFEIREGARTVGRGVVVNV